MTPLKKSVFGPTADKFKKMGIKRAQKKLDNSAAKYAKKLKKELKDADVLTDNEMIQKYARNKAESKAAAAAAEKALKKELLESSAPFLKRQEIKQKIMKSLSSLVEQYGQGVVRGRAKVHGRGTQYVR